MYTAVQLGFPLVEMQIVGNIPFASTPRAHASPRKKTLFVDEEILF